MKLKHLGIIMLTSTILLAGCGKQSSQNNTTSSKTSSSSVSSSSNSQSQSDSSSSQNTSSSSSSDNKDSSSATSGNANVADENNKYYGVMVGLLVAPNFLKTYINDRLYYNPSASSHYGALKGWSYLSAHGDPASFIYFKYINADDIAIKYIKTTDKPIADTPYTTIHVTAKRLMNDYFVNKAQQAEVRGYVDKLKPEISQDK